MVNTISERWKRLKSHLEILPAFIRRVHRIVAVLWLLTFVVATAGVELPGPSLAGLSFIAVIITGSYLLLRPWVRGESTASDRWKRLKNWDVTRPVFVRRTHRVVATLLLFLIVLALSIQAAGGPEPQLIIVPIAALLLYLAVTGVYMILGPWVNRFRAG